MAKYISGVWRVSRKKGLGPTDSTSQEVKVTINNNTQCWKLVFNNNNDAADQYDYPYSLWFYSTDGSYNSLINPVNAPETYFDFGDEPQEVSEDFLVWMNHMAEPWAKVSGMWEFNETLEFNTLYPLENDAVDFVYECKNDLLANFNRIYFDLGGGSYGAMSYGVYGQWLNTAYTTSNKWNADDYRYIQFGEKQYVPVKFKTWLQKNAKHLGDYAIEAGDHCFKLDIYNELKEFFGHSINIPFTFKTPEGNIFDCVSMSLAICDYTDNPSLWYYGAMGGWEAYEYSDIDSTKFRALGWRTKYHDRLDGSFQNRFITVTEKTYLPYKSYNFLSSTLIPLNSQELLNTVGACDMIQSVDTVTNLINKYAKHLTYKPQAETLYFNAAGAQSIEGLDLSKYLYVTIRGSANSANTTIANPVSATFAVQQIGSSYITVQLADSYHWATWQVYTSKIIYSSRGTDGSAVSGQAPKIYEVVGYRFEPHFLTTGIVDPTYGAEEE